MRPDDVNTEDLDYNHPSTLVNVFERERRGMTAEQRQRDDEDFQSFCDWLLLKEIDDEAY